MRVRCHRVYSGHMTDFLSEQPAWVEWVEWSADWPASLRGPQQIWEPAVSPPRLLAVGEAERPRLVRVPKDAYLRFAAIDSDEKLVAFVREYGFLGGRAFVGLPFNLETRSGETALADNEHRLIEEIAMMRWCLDVALGRIAGEAAHLFPSKPSRGERDPWDALAGEIERRLEGIRFIVRRVRPEPSSTDTRPVTLTPQPSCLLDWLWLNCALVISGGDGRTPKVCPQCGSRFEVGGTHNGARRTDAVFCGRDACRKAYARKHGSVRPIPKARRGHTQKPRQTRQAPRRATQRKRA